MDSNNQDNQNPVIAGAITFPSRSEDVRSVPIQPRQPTNLQGLLRFAMEATKAEDAPGNSELGPMDEERKRFLEEALKSLTVDVIEVLQKAIKILTDKERIQSIQLGEAVPDHVKAAFNDLLEYIDDLDVANDFYKLGGFAIFPICYGSENEEIRSSASSILAELCQNNPFCQTRALECGLLNVLVNLARSEKGLPLTKTIYALSCATRAFDPACRELIAQDGCNVLLQLLREPDPAVRTKTAFLIRYLCQNYAQAKAQFIEKNLVRTTVEQIKQQRDDTTEHLLSVLLLLVDAEDSRVLRQCRDPELQLKHILEELLKHPELQNDTYLEEKEYCQELLKKVFENWSETNDDDPDR